MKTPLSKRWPVGLGIFLALFASAVVGHESHHFWVGALAYVGTVLVWALLLRYVGGLPWSRIVRSREPE